MSNGVNAPYGLSPVQSQIGNGRPEKLGAYNIYASADGVTTYGGSIFKGDFVTLKPGPTGTTTLADVFANNPDAGTIVAGIVPNAGAAGSVSKGLPVGIFMGCQYTEASHGLQVNSDYWPASTKVKAGSKIIAFVNDDPEIVFKIQISTSTNGDATTTQNNVIPMIYQTIFNGQNAKLQVGGVAFTNADYVNNPATGDTASGSSAYYLDGSTITYPDVKEAAGSLADIEMNVKIIGLVPETIDNNNSGLIQGSTMPFIDVLCKFNRHIHGSTGTPSGLTFKTA